MKIKVFEKGVFYCEDTETELNEREIQDCEAQYIILDRNCRVGIVTSSCNEDFIEWIDDQDDERYRIERG